MRSLLLALLLTASFAPQAAATLPLAANLELVPNRTLPGVPVMFVITVTNPNVEPQTFYEYARLTVTDGHGATFPIRWNGRAEGSLLDTLRAGQGVSHTAVIPKGGTIKYYVPVGEELLENGAFYDSRLCAPGTYDLQMALGQAGEAKTNIARLMVQQPTGSDLTFLQAIAALKGAGNLNASTWPDVASLVEKYPDSKYYQLLAFHRVPSEKPEDIIALMKQALLSGLPGPIADEFQDQIAYSYEAIALGDAKAGDFQAAADALRQAEAWAAKTADHPSTDYARQHASDVRVHLQATASEIERRRLRRGFDLWMPVKLFVQCRAKDGRVRFGYQNPNSAVVIKVGAANHFDPEPADRGQPIQFESGNDEHTFSVFLLAGERSLSWILKDTTVTFSLDAPTTKECDDGEEGDGR